MKKRTKKAISILLILSMVAGMPAVSNMKFTEAFGGENVYATSTKEKKKQAEKDLENVKENIEDIKDSQAEVKSDIASKAAKLDTLMDKQDKVKVEIDNKQAEIVQCNEDLEAAKQKVAEEYQAMKLRIQFMYENSTSDSLASAILEAKGFADMLNRIEYVTDIYNSDRKLMAAYQESVDEVVALSEKLNTEMEDLVALQDQYEKDRANLEYLIASLEKEKDAYATQLARAEQQAKDVQDKIDKYAAIIQAEEAAAANAGADYGGGGTGNGGVSDSVDYLNDPSYDPDPVTDVSGAEVVAYALQFVGNPYVWGGNSLTKGCDCSGFVHLVYKHFGISTPRYSQAFKSQGQPVAFVNIKAGDVVVYPGHVAIAIGNGCIVEAQSTKAGITCGRSVTCHTITGLRRYV